MGRAAQGLPGDRAQRGAPGQHDHAGALRRAQPGGGASKLAAAGAQLRPYSPEILEAAYKGAQEVYAETAAENADFKKLYDSLWPFRGDGFLWWQVAEYSFDSFSIRSRGKA